MGFALNTLNDDVRAYLRGANVTTNSGDVVVDANFSPIVVAVSIGGSLARGEKTSVAVAGAAAVNTLNGDIEAFISDGSTVDSAGSVTVDANDDSQLLAIAGSISVAWNKEPDQAKGATSVSVGASIAVNDIGLGNGHSVQATIDNPNVVATGDVSVDASVTGSVHAVAVGGAVSVAATKGQQNVGGHVAFAIAGGFSR